MSRYYAYIESPSWRVGPYRGCATLTEARQWAESFGTTADSCFVYRGRYGASIAALFRRDPEGNGERWYRATP